MVRTGILVPDLQSRPFGIEVVLYNCYLDVLRSVEVISVLSLCKILEVAGDHGRCNVHEEPEL